MNADVLTNKIQELIFRVNEVNPDIIGINEILPKYFKKEIHKEFFELLGYEQITNIDDYKEHSTLRGSIMYIKKGITYKSIKLTPLSDNLEEGIYVEINLHGNIVCHNVCCPC